MIMISKGEAYGLVYLEAMSRGCITIASRDEGMDGVIKDGINGFLCKAGDAAELASIIQHINLLSSNEKRTISSNAIRTARELTDKLVAEKYLNDVMA
jgi:glycosyltransferase involved in cell wall biosynthesis